MAVAGVVEPLVYGAPGRIGTRISTGIEWETTVKFRADANVAIHVPGRERAAQFYGDVSGFTGVSQSNHQLVYETGKLRLYVNLDADEALPFIPALLVSDVDAARKHLTAAGVRIRSDWGSTSMYIEDPWRWSFVDAVGDEGACAVWIAVEDENAIPAVLRRGIVFRRAVRVPPGSNGHVLVNHGLFGSRILARSN